MLDGWEREFVQRQQVARLATVRAGGAPHIVPVCFVLHAGAFVLPVDEKPKASIRLLRLRNVERDPRVSLLFDEYGDDWSQLAWVRVDGVAEVVSPEAGAVAALRARYPRYREMAIDALPAIVVRPGKVASWRWTPR